MNKNLLSNLTILDLSQRLPGPLATNILCSLGAKVIKVEPPHKEDAFILFSKEDEIFGHWYKKLNQHKTILKLEHNLDALKSYILDSDIIVLSQGSSLIAQIKKEIDIKSKAILEVCGSHNQKPMHDLNALALTHSFQIFTHNQKEKRVSPPYLPFSGITFGQQIATEALAAYIKMQQEGGIIHQSIYIDLSTQAIFDKFWDQSLIDKNPVFLHNGKYPCYNLYRTKDGHYVALAAVEDKFWLKFIEIFKLPLKIEDRFDTSVNTFKILEDAFSNITLSEIKGRIKNEDLCLTPID